MTGGKTRTNGVAAGVKVVAGIEIIGELGMKTSGKRVRISGGLLRTRRITGRGKKNRRKKARSLKELGGYAMELPSMMGVFESFVFESPFESRRGVCIAFHGEDPCSESVPEEWSLIGKHSGLLEEGYDLIVINVGQETRDYVDIFLKVRKLKEQMPCILMGKKWGANAAIEIACLHKDLVNGVIVLSPDSKPAENVSKIDKRISRAFLCEGCDDEGETNLWSRKFGRKHMVSGRRGSVGQKIANDSKGLRVVIKKMATDCAKQWNAAQTNLV